MKHWSWASASCIGTAHRQSALPLQDAHACRTIVPDTLTDDITPWLLAIACDGAGSASHSRQGAILTCRILTQAIGRHLRMQNALPDDDLLDHWIDEARAAIGRAASARGLRTRDFACTLVLALSNGEQTLTAHIGDGGIVAHHEQTQQWQAISWPEHGEYAATTHFITDTPPSPTRMARFHEPFDALAVFTDGIERLVLDMQNRVPHAPFFGAMTTPLLDEVPVTVIREAYEAEAAEAAAAAVAPDAAMAQTTAPASTVAASGTGIPQGAPGGPAAIASRPRYWTPPVWQGRHHALSAQLASYLDSDAINARTDDDKTLIVAILP